MVMRELPERRPTFVLSRGQYDAPREAVEPGVPEFILHFPKTAPRNRLGLAQWLTDPANPLTARVIVNRFWQSLFGTGLVKTSENFGYQGEVPSHPELLDWLALDFVEHHWDVKRLLRLIVTSATYRQDSRSTEKLNELDPRTDCSPTARDSGLRVKCCGTRRSLSADCFTMKSAARRFSRINRQTCTKASLSLRIIRGPPTQSPPAPDCTGAVCTPFGNARFRIPR
jgi:hypothetical protein